MSTQQDINAFRAQRIANTHDLCIRRQDTQTPGPPHIPLITHYLHATIHNPTSTCPHNHLSTQNYLQHPMQNPGDISNPTIAFNMALVLMAKAFALNDTTPTNNNQRSSSNPSSMQIAQPGMNMDQDRQMLMVEDNVGNQFRPNAMHNVGNQVVLNANVRNQHRLRVMIAKRKKHDSLTSEEFDFMAAVDDSELDPAEAFSQVGETMLGQNQSLQTRSFRHENQLFVNNEE
ncbi:hypothetical protein Tco_0566169 [Tanacetum coccineum]